MYCFASLFSSHIFQSFPNCLPFTLTLPTLHCYLHLKLFQNPKSKHRRPFFHVLQKPWKILNTKRPTHHHTQTHKNTAQVYKHFLEPSVCGLFFSVWLSQRYAHFYLGVPWTNLDDTTHTDTRSILSCTAQCYILWFSSEGDGKSMLLLLTSENAPHL